MIRFIAKFFIVFAVYMSFCGVLQGAGDVAFQSGVSFTALFTRAVLGYVGQHFSYQHGIAMFGGTYAIGAIAVLAARVFFFRRDRVETPV